MSIVRVPLGKFVKVIGGFAFKSEDFSDSGAPVVRISDIQDGGVNIGGTARISPDKLGKGSKYKIAPGDILIAMSGATTGKIGVVARELNENVYLNQRIGNFRIIDPLKVEKGYLRYVLQAPDYQLQISRAMVGVAQPNISPSQLESFEIPLPSLPEQCRIATILDKTDSLREKRRQVIAKLDELLKSVFIEMFGDPVTNPKGWKIIELGDLVQVVGGYAFQSELFSENGEGIVRISNLEDGTLNLNNLARILREKLGKGVRYAVEPGDVLIAMSGATTGKLGVVPLDLEVKLYQNQRVGNFKILNPNRIERTFLISFLKSRYYQSNIWQLAWGAAQPNISSKQLESAKMILPSFDQQQRFAIQAAAIERLKSKSQTSIESLDSLFTSLQQRAFSGELFTEKTVSTSLLTEVAQHV